MTNPFTETTSWSYQNNNWLAAQTLANGATASYTHNALGQVTRLLNQIGVNTISDFSSIGYDGAGNRNSVTASIPGATALSGVTGYSYDTKDQISQETSTRNSGFTDNFSYDSAGNPTSFKGVTKSYNSNNQQTGTGFTHDGNGNPTTYSGTTLTFDPENRLTAYGSALTAGYIGDGLRAWKQNSSGRTYFLYDGIVPVIELDSSAGVTATNTFGAAGLVSRRTGSTSVFYNFDSEGNITQRSDSTGTVLSNHIFSAHGAALGGTLSDPFGYKARFGYYTDSDMGLLLLALRHYSPNSGRFLTSDPISYKGGVNVFAYVHNDPINRIDPLGLDDADKEWYPEEDGKPLFPRTSPMPFEEGGILSAGTLAEFITGNERSKQPCKKFGERFWDSFSETNQAIPGTAAPFGTTLITGPGAAQITGQPGILGWAWGGGGPGFGSSIIQSAATSVATHAAFEGGVAVGSYINAIGCPCGY